jgi:hypothetical protein
MAKTQRKHSTQNTPPAAVTTLDEIRVQAEAAIIAIPGYRPGTVINVKVQPVDVTPYILGSGMVNPLMALALKGAKEGKTADEIRASLDGKAAALLAPSLDNVCKEALLEPTWDEIVAIRPLTIGQKLAIFDWVSGDISELQFFR